MSKTLSGKAVMRVLCRSFGFRIVSQRGSHVKLRARSGSRIVFTVIPLHRELVRGTLRGVLELAQVDEEAFWKAAR